MIDIANNENRILRFKKVTFPSKALIVDLTNLW